MSVELVVIGGSWGGFDALCKLLSTMPKHGSTPFVVALHRSPRSKDGRLERMLAEGVQLDVITVEDKTQLEPGCVHLAPADYHLLIEDGSLALSTEALVQCSRPSIDVLFDSAAQEYGAGVVGIVLTGANSDGAAGIAAIKAHGGSTMAQDPSTAVKPAMPQAAINTGQVDFVGTVPQIARKLAGLLGVAMRS